MKKMFLIFACVLGCAQYDVNMGDGVQEIDSEQLQGTDSEQLQGTDSEQLQGTDSEQLQGTDSEQLQGTDSEQLECFIDDGIQNPNRDSFLIEIETAVNPDANGRVFRCFANSDFKNMLETGKTNGVLGFACQVETQCEKPGDCDCADPYYW